jgi:hypothetical protein
MKTSKKQIAIDFLMSKPNAKKETFHSLEIIQYGLIVAIFQGKSHKPYKHYRFDDESALNRFIQDEKERELKAEKERVERSKQYEAEKQKIVEGAILYSSWGYEQTNIDFYIVVSRKNDFVILQEVGQKRTYDRDDSGKCTPDASVKIGDPFRKKINRFAGVNLNSYSWCGLWDGRAMNWSSYA